MPHKQNLHDLRAEMDALQQRLASVEAALPQATGLEQQKLEADIAKTQAEKAKIDREADPASLERQKLQADIAKTQAEKGKIDREANPASLEQQKLQAEIAKTQAEKGKIDREADPAAHNYLPGLRELDKLAAEKAKLDGEKAKLDAEVRKLGHDKVLDWFKLCGALAAAVAALLTYWATALKNAADEDARFRTDAAQLAQNLGAPQAQLRAAAAVGLGRFLDDPRTHGLALSSLAYAIGLESQIDVQQAIADSLVKAGQDAVASLRQTRSRLNGEVEIALSKAGDVGNCMGYQPALESVRQQQNGLITAVLALSRIEHKPADFQELDFKCYEFYRVNGDLRGAVFARAILWYADFFQTEVREADFRNVVAPGAKFQQATLSSAQFAGADLHGARFDQAVLDGVDFSDAQLDRTCFAGATGLTEAPLKRAKSLAGAVLPPPLAQPLAAQTRLPAGTQCPP
jgi:hypothetical protein